MLRIDSRQSAASVASGAAPSVAWRTWWLTEAIFPTLRAARRNSVKVRLFAYPIPRLSFRVEGLDNARRSAFLGHLNVTSRSFLVVVDAVCDFGHRDTGLQMAC